MSPQTGVKVLVRMEFTAKTLRDRIYVVTSYFNWDGYNRKLANFRAFANRLHEQQIPLFAIECALGDRPFELGESAALRARTQSRLWQKEKLLNFAIRRLPESCEYVVWMDADLIFPDNGWPSRVQHALADADVVQTFSTVIRLAEDNNLESLSTRVDKGIIASLKHKNEHILSSRGHPGFAWAARRQFLLDWPLYDAAIVGGADKMMLCAWSDIADCPVTRSMTSPRSFKHFLDWAKGGRCRVSYAPGVVYHLWHGEQKPPLSTALSHPSGF